MTAVDDVLAHHGVKGMKWGVRKKYSESRDRPAETKSYTTPSGKKVTLEEHRIGPIPAALGVISPSVRKSLKSGRSFKVHADGKAVGDVRIHEISKDEVNFVWMGVNSKSRGQGYASTIFDAGVEHAKKSGYKKITLEVPGNAPDARHIYEKRGFKQSGSVIGNSKDIWGGLTPMTLKIG